MIPITQLTGRLGNLMFDFAFINAFARDNNLNDGYFPQDLRWFDHHGETIKEMYRRGMNMTPRPEIAIHVRRGDYCEPNKPQYPLPMEYYQKAMALFQGEQFVVFSDDFQFCCDEPTFKGCKVISSQDPIEDFNEMARCKYLIIANSTFSWWAAYIAPFAVRVIMPRQWETGRWSGRVMTAPAHWERL